MARRAWLARLGQRVGDVVFPRQFMKDRAFEYYVCFTVEVCEGTADASVIGRPIEVQIPWSRALKLARDIKRVAEAQAENQSNFEIDTLD